MGSIQPNATRARTQSKLNRVSSLLHGPSEMANCCAPSSTISGTHVTVTAWFGVDKHRTSAVGDTFPTTKNSSGTCEPSSDVFRTKVAASKNVEQSDPIHPPSHKHTAVGMHLPFELQSFGQDARADGAADPAGAIG